MGIPLAWGVYTTLISVGQVLRLIEMDAPGVDLSGAPSSPRSARDELRQRIRAKSRLKGRQPDDASLAEVRELLGRGRPAAGGATC